MRKKTARTMRVTLRKGTRKGLWTNLDGERMELRKSEKVRERYFQFFSKSTQ